MRKPPDHSNKCCMHLNAGEKGIDYNTLIFKQIRYGITFVDFIKAF